MLTNREVVVGDYRSVWLRCRHPVAFLGAESDQRDMISYADLRTIRDGH